MGKHRSRGIAADRDRQGGGEGGGNRTGFEGVDRGCTSTGTIPCGKGAKDGPWDTHMQLSSVIF